LEDSTLVTLNSAPKYMQLYLEENNLDWNHRHMNEDILLKMMGADGYITHHLLDQTTLSKIAQGMQSLMQVPDVLEDLKKQFQKKI